MPTHPGLTNVASGWLGTFSVSTDNQILVRNVKPLTGSKISLPPGNLGPH
jgi:hypothetical protein